MTVAPHFPVLLNEVIAHLAPQDGDVFVDGTFGAGGYSRAILAAADCQVIAIDRDPSVLPRAAALSAEFPGRFRLVSGCFGDMEGLLEQIDVSTVDGVVLDIGVSSMQIDQADRGFSFQADGPLDMRMSKDGASAADLVNTLPQDDLADLIFTYGEERHSRKIARAIVAVRADRPITGTKQLADIVERAVPGGIHAQKKGGVHAATRTFQALRISVNDELGELERGLYAAERLLKSGGRLVVVSFHSLEDRIVKTFLRSRSGGDAGGSRHLPAKQAIATPSFELITRKAVDASADELAQNTRSRSAKLRAARRTDAAPWPSIGAAA